MTSMDIDVPDVPVEDIANTLPSSESIAKAEGKKPLAVPVDEAHPFDLEAYDASYSGELLSRCYALFVPLNTLKQIERRYIDYCIS